MGYYNDYLSHHGILGQKWGVRRFQRPDGTRTAAGKKRQRGDYSDDQNASPKKQFDKEKAKKIAKGVAIGAAVVGATAGAGLLVATNPTLAAGFNKVTDCMYTYGKRKIKELPAKIDKAGDAMVMGALGSIGGIAISKIANKMDPGPNATELQKNTARVATDSVSAGIRTLTGPSKNSNNNNNNSQKNQQNNSNPNLKVDKQSQEYQHLFDGLTDKDERDAIREAANSGASMEELRRKREELGHSGLFDLTKFRR